MTKLKTRIAVGLVAAIGVGAMATAIATAGASTGHATATDHDHDDDPCAAGTGQWPASRVLLCGHCPRRWGNGQAGGRRRLLDDEPVPAGRCRRVPHVRGPRHKRWERPHERDCQVRLCEGPGPARRSRLSTAPTRPSLRVVLDSGVAGRQDLPARGRELLRHGRHQPVPAGLTAAIPSEIGVFTQQGTPQVASMLTIEPSS